jgi:hypothetical protein
MENPAAAAAAAVVWVEGPVVVPAEGHLVSNARAYVCCGFNLGQQQQQVVVVCLTVFV